MTDEKERLRLADRVGQLSPAQLENLGELIITGPNGLVALVVATKTRQPSSAELRAHVQNTLPDFMVPSRVVVVRELPKLPNGKIDRSRLHLAEETLIGRSEDPSTEIEKRLADVWGSVLSGIRIGRGDHFFEIGGDSILSIQVISRSRMAGLPLEATDLFEYPVLSQLATMLEDRVRVDPQASIASVPIGRAKNVDSSESVPLTPAHHWFFSTVKTDCEHWNLGPACEVDRSVDIGLLAEAVRRLPESHDGLRLRFDRIDDGWAARISSTSRNACPVEVVDVSDLTNQEIEIERRIQDDERAFDLANGPLVKCTIFDRGVDSNYLLALTLHHLVVDIVSIQLLLDEIEHRYEALVQAEIPSLFRGESFSAWADALQTHADSEAIASEAEFWNESIAGDMSLPWPGHEMGSPIRGTEGEAISVQTALSNEETASLLGDVHLPYGTATDEIVLAALWLGLSDMFSETAVTIGIERHGREPIGEIDPSFTVGWMTSFFPVTLPSATGLGEGAAIRLAKERLRKISNNGLGYGLLRYLHKGPHRLQVDDEMYPDVIFNYLGEKSVRSGRRLMPVAASEFRGRSSRCERSCTVEVNAWIDDAQLEISWTFAGDLDDEVRSTLMEAFNSRLHRLITHCLETTTVRHTPSDFPAAELDQEELDRFLDSL